MTTPSSVIAQLVKPNLERDRCWGHLFGRSISGLHWGTGGPLIVVQRRSACPNPSATIELERDALGRVIAEITNGTRVESEIDCCGRRVKRTIGDQVVDYTYDGMADPKHPEHASLKEWYAFMSESFKTLDKLAFLRKGSPLPNTHTLHFNREKRNIALAHSICGETSLASWFSCNRRLAFDEEVIGLGSYGYTLTVLSSEELAEDPDDKGHEEEGQLLDSWTPKFARGR